MPVTVAGEAQYILEARGLSKTFGGVVALDNVDLQLKAGEILGVVGDNGAGKSTLIKAITGAINRNTGRIFFNGEEVTINSPTDAKRLGIETVYQDLALVNCISVTKNIFLGREIVRAGIAGRLFGLLDFRRTNAEVRALFKRMKIDIVDLHRDASYFSGGQRQAIALSKTVQFGKRIAILDEPTASLGVKESKSAMDLVQSLKGHGLSVIMITHNMQHVLQYCDRVMVLRVGRTIAVKEVSQINGDQLVAMITGAADLKAA
jgi:fructose transport system ATP-binding protein